MKKYKTSHKFAIGLGVTLILFSQNAYAEDIKELENKKIQLEQEASNSKNKKSDLEQELSQVESEIQKLEIQLSTLTKQLDTTNKEIIQTKASILNIETDINKTSNIIKEKEKDLNNKKAKIEQNLKLMYSRGDVQFLEFLFRSENLSQFLFRYEKLNDIMNQGKKLHNEVLKELNFVKKQKEILDLNKSKLEVEKRNLEEKKLQQLNQEVEQQQIQESLNAKKKQVKIEIDEEDIAMANLAAAISKAEKDIQVEKYKIEVAKRKAEEERKRQEIERQKQVQSLNPNSALRKEISNSNSSSNESTFGLGNAILASPMQPGTYTMTSPYGYRTHPITGKRKLHNGTDFAAPRNTPIYAMEDGYVLFSGPANGYGNWIVIKHSNGLYTIYGHMYDDGLYVKPGEYVFRGQKIGGVGSNGGSTGNHLHFCVATSFNGSTFTYVNPMNYIN